MGKICYICKKAGQNKLPKAHEERLLKELGFSESNLPPKNAFFCREHFTEDSFKFVDYRTVWNYNPRVKVLSNDSGSPGNTLGEAGAYEVEILEEYDDESFAGSSVPPSLTNNLNQALGTASEEAGFTGFEIPNECDDESFGGVSVPSVDKSLKNDLSISVAVQKVSKREYLFKIVVRFHDNYSTNLINKFLQATTKILTSNETDLEFRQHLVQLTRRTRTHTKEKPFNCEHCSKLTFSCRRSITRHINNIHLKQPREDIVQQKCKLCYKKLSSRSLLLAYIRTFH